MSQQMTAQQWSVELQRQIAELQIALKAEQRPGMRRVLQGQLAAARSDLRTYCGVR